MPIPQRLDYYRRDTHGLALITLVGEIDLDSSPLLHEALAQCLHDGMNTIDIDLASVTFCDCHGLGILLDAAHHAIVAGGALRLRHPGAVVAQLLTLTGTDSLLLGRPVGAATNSLAPLPSSRRETEQRPAATVLALTGGAR